MKINLAFALLIANYEIPHSNDYNGYNYAFGVFKNEENGNVSVNSVCDENPNMYELDSSRRMKFFDEALKV